MKIFILANNDVGLYKFRKELIEKFIELGHELIISLPDGEMVPKLTALGCRFICTPVDRRGMNPLRDYALLKYYKKMMHKQKPDIVITYTIKPNIYGGMAAKQSRIPYYINITGLGTAFQKDGFVKKLVVTMYQWVCKNVKVIFFENEGNRQVFIDEHIAKINQTCLLNGAGVNTEEYSYTEYPDEKEGIRFLFIGRIMKEKGIEELADAFQKLYHECENENGRQSVAGEKKIQLDIVGPCEEEYRERMDELFRHEGITYYGFQEDVKPFIRRCHCLVLPSYHEGMANTLLEAGAMGRPLITSDICGCKESVCTGEELKTSAISHKMMDDDITNGLLVKAQDSEDLYNKMKIFIQLSLSKREKMGKLSAEFIAEKFSKEKVVVETIAKILD